MKKFTTVKFTCPGCGCSFEFDAVGEHEFVPCPICGTDCITVKKGSKLTLETFDPAQNCDAPLILA